MQSTANPTSTLRAAPRAWRAWARRLAWCTLAPVELACLAWSALALSIDAHAQRWLVLLLVAATAALLVFHRPRWQGQVAFLALFAALLAWWFGLEPRNDRRWLADVARPTTLELDGDQLTVHDLRNFDWSSETEFTPRWEERRYDLAKLAGLDFYLSDWGAAGIVHTMLAWEFEDSEPLAISIEVRKEEGEGYSAVRGFFRQFELYYVVADERDVIRVRTNFRGERVRLYRSIVPLPVARALLESYAERINRLAREPAWYNALTHNCTTMIRLHAQELGHARPLDWRLYLNARSDELLYDRGRLDTTLPFEELKRKSDVTEASRAAGTGPDYSRLLRQGLPPRGPVAK